MARIIEDIYAKLDFIGGGAHAIVNRAVDLRRLPEEQQIEFKAIAREMRLHGDRRPDLKRRREQLEEKFAVSAESIRALKKINLKSKQEGFSMEAIREIKFLQELDHENVVKVLDVYQMDSNVNVVLEFMNYDLGAIIDAMHKKTILVRPADVKQYMRMLLSGLHHCHQNFLLHRDIKPQNCLIASNGTLKLADFGLARSFASPRPAMSPEVYTIWYRAPELLFGARAYGIAADMWAVGCVFGELLLGTPLFPSAHPFTELGQLHLIGQALGAVTEANWPGCTQLPLFLEMAAAPATPVLWNTTFDESPHDVVELLQALLCYDPRQRPSAQQALEYAYFRSEPAPTPIQDLPRLAVKKE